MILLKIQDMFQEARLCFEQFQLYLFMLANGHLSPSLVSPHEFRRALTQINAKLLSILSLAADPQLDLWKFINSSPVPLTWNMKTSSS